MNNSMHAYSSLLFASPSFLEGMARAVDFGDFLTEYNSSPAPELADLNALQSDWMAVGQDMSQAFAEVRREKEATSKE